MGLPFLSYAPYQDHQFIYTYCDDTFELKDALVTILLNRQPTTPLSLEHGVK